MATSGAIVTLPDWARTQNAGWKVLVFDAAGMIVDIPEADVEAIDCEDIINGGSSVGTLVLRRDINNVGQIAHGFTVAVFIVRYRFDAPYAGYDVSIFPPGDPWFVGTIVDINQEQLVTHGRITCQLEGESKLLDEAIVTETINPGVGGNGPLTAVAYLTYLINAYQPTNFLPPAIPATMFNLLPASFDGTQLGTVIDQLVKQGRDTFGLLYTWRVVTNFSLPGALTRRVVIQSDQNPNVLPGVNFYGLINNSDITEYKVETKYRDIKNVVAAYGGRDPVSQITVYGVYDDPVSIAQFGPRETKLTNTFILDQATLQSWVTSWLDINAYPQAQVTFKMVTPDQRIRGGAWIRIIEAPTDQDVTAGAPGVSKDLRISTVKLTIKGARVDQVVTTVSPTPYLDQALYRLGLHSQAQALQQAANAQFPAVSTTFIFSGGLVTAQTNGSPASITFSAGIAVFAGVRVPFPAQTFSLPVDGQYFTYVDSSGAWILFTNQRRRPTTVATQLPIRQFQVIGGVVYA